MLKKLKLEYVLYLFLIIQPLFNIYRTFFGDNIKILGFSFFELTNTITIFVMLLLAIQRMKSKKPLLILLILFSCIGIYSFIHYYNMTQFDKSIIELDTYGYVKETYYIVRVYGFPIILLFTCIFAKVNKKIAFKAIYDTGMLVAFIVFITNILTISFCSYHKEFHEYIIQGNFFDWFTLTGAEYMKNYTSSGWFQSGNEVSAILLVVFPFVVYNTFSNKSIKNVIKGIIYMLAMLMVGTKTAVLGSIGVFIIMLGYFLILNILDKNYQIVKQISICSFIWLILWSICFYNSPFLREIYPHSKGDNQVSIKEEESEKLAATTEELKNKSFQLKLDTEADRKFALEYMQNNFWNHYIQDQMIQRYPFENDLPYYVEVFNRNPALNANFRFYRKDFIDRIIERNNRSLDKFVGIGVLQNYYIERDYIYQYAMFGIIGLLLLIGSYIIFVAKGSIQFLLKNNLKRNFMYISILLSAGIAIVLPYVMGHMFDVPMIMFVIATIIAVLNNFKEPNNEKEDCNSTSC